MVQDDEALKYGRICSIDPELGPDYKPREFTKEEIEKAREIAKRHPRTKPVGKAKI